MEIIQKCHNSNIIFIYVFVGFTVVLFQKKSCIGLLLFNYFVSTYNDCLISNEIFKYMCLHSLIFWIFLVYDTNWRFALLKV